MNEADASPGGGAVTPAPAAPPASTGATPPAEPAIPVSQLKAVVSEAFGELRNGLFADLRKAGALGKEKPSEAPPQSAPAAAPASTGLSASDVEAMLDRRTAITRAEVEHKLTDKQVKRMMSALEADKPTDSRAWVSAYLTDMGIAKAADAQPTPTTVTPAAVVALPSAAPISDKGSPAPGGVTNWEREYAENPLGMSAAARNLMDAKFGAEKARRMRVEAGLKQGENIRVVATPQR